ncbi:hypothetical protein C3L33_15226, partial [Rhododendron williamsianum]
MGKVGRMKLGSRGLEVSAQGLGCAGISRFNCQHKPEEEIIKLIHHAVDSGVTFLDTADVYGPHTAKSSLARREVALKGGVREKVELATKFGLFSVDGKFEVHGDPAYVRAACEASLKRLTLIASISITSIGSTPVSPLKSRRAHAVHPISAVQLEWSLWTRDVEEEIVPTCRELGIGIVAYSPLGRGFFASGAKVVESWATGDPRKVCAYETYFSLSE